MCENPAAFAPMISLARYTSLLSLPDVGATFLASLLGRLPIGITGLAVLLLVRSSSGSFAYAGSTTACYVAGLGAVAPILGKLIDRRGPRKVLTTCGVLYPFCLLALLGSIAHAAPAWVSMVLAAAAGASYPPITVSMRTFLKQRLPDASSLSTAYSLESVLIETIFIAGPMLVALFVAAASARLAVLFAAACAAAGTFLFLRSPALKHWPIQPPRVSTLFGPLSLRSFRSLVAIVLAYSLAFGLVEIGVTGFAAEIGRPALAGLLLGLMSVGSVTGGVVYGSRAWHMPLNRQFALALALMGTGMLPLTVLSGAWTFACFCVLAGVVMAPALTMQSMLVAKTAPAEILTEAFTWSATALLTGVGLGFALGGAILQLAASPAVLLTAAAASLGAAAASHTILRDNNLPH